MISDGVYDQPLGEDNFGARKCVNAGVGIEGGIAHWFPTVHV